MALAAPVQLAYQRMSYDLQWVLKADTDLKASFNTLLRATKIDQPKSPDLPKETILEETIKTQILPSSLSISLVFSLFSSTLPPKQLF